MKFGAIDRSGMASAVNWRTASRDRFTIDLKCPKCGKPGTAEVSEDDYPFMRSPGFRIDQIPDGFVETRYSDRRVETFVKCIICNVEFNL